MANKKNTTVTTTTTTTEEIVEQKIVETHYLLILDKSGSMSSLRDKTISSFNEQIQTIKRLNKEFSDQKYFISLITFNDKIDETYMNIPVEEIKEITLKDYNPDGGTALLDAMGQGISRLEDSISPSMVDSSKIVTAVVVVMTDGEENASKTWSTEKVKTLVERLNKDDRWTISYIGANQDAIMNSRNLGVNVNNTVNYVASAGGTRAVADALSYTMSMRAQSFCDNGNSLSAGTNLNFFADYGGTISEDSKKTILTAPPAKDITEAENEEDSKA
jgi:uncharacterized protein YegL